jgi:DNA-directed RNA polymerase subunit K/omega
VVRCPDGFNRFEFIVLSGLRATQLSRGSLPRVTASHKLTTTALHEIAEKKVLRLVPDAPA